MRRVALIQHIRKNLSTKHAIRIIFHENKFAHIQELFKKNNILNTCQLNILNNLLFLHRVKSRKVTNDLLSNISRPSHRSRLISLQIIISYLPLSEQKASTE